MFDNLVTYHIHRQALLPPSDALAYQYILAGNGLFIRAETHFFEAILPIASCTVRGDQTGDSMKSSINSTIMGRRSR